jgi:uncharacterized circularly permuted ATP-grasp superfamily protein
MASFRTVLEGRGQAGPTAVLVPSLVPRTPSAHEARAAPIFPRRSSWPERRVVRESMFDGYEPLADVYDEAFVAPGRPRPHYLPLLEALADCDLDAMGQELKSGLRKGEVTFGASPDGLFALDLVPRLLTAREWNTIRGGVVQRARVLDNFAADVYADRAIVAAGILPERVIEGSAHYEPAMRYAPPPQEWVSVVGFDLVRNPDGDFVVLEDQIRMPSGLGYALAAREVLPEALGVPPPPSEDLRAIMGRLGETLRAMAPESREDPTVVVLSSGPDGAGWYEHERIGRELEIPVVTLDQLEGGDDKLSTRVNGRSTRIDVVYQRTDEDRFTDEAGEPTSLGSALLGPCRSGKVACVNAPGSGIGDDKLVHAYVEEMTRFYLGEEPVLRSVDTHDLGVPEKREAALERMDELVVKPRGEMGGEGVVVWSEADDDERGEVRRALEEHPDDWIAQRRVELSCHPTLCEGRLRPRRVDLRPYVIRVPGGRESVVPGLSRVALEEGSLIVNSSRGGGVKDTWLSAIGGGADRDT